MSKVYTYRYDADYDPATPIVDIEIGRAMAEVSLTLTSLVDSGADATVIPMRYLQQIRARRSRKKWMRGTAAAIQELVAALADENETIRWTAAAGLRQIGGVGVAGALQAFMEQTEDTAAKAEAEKVLQSLGSYRPL